MSFSTLKILVLSLLAFLATASATVYVLYEQERNGRAIRDGMLSVKTWDASRGEFTVSPLPDERGTDIERLGELVLRSEADTVAFLAFVDDLRERTGVSISATALKEVKTSESGFDQLSASFQLQGDQASVERTLELFEHLPYLFQIESLSLLRHPDFAEAHLVVLVSSKE
jgi:hypothetical protein